MKTIHIDNKGLFVDPNPYLIPDGSLAVAENVNIEEKGIIKSRAGFEMIRSNIPLKNNEFFINVVHFSSSYIVMTNERLLKIALDGSSLIQISELPAVSYDTFTSFNHLIFVSKKGLYKLSASFKVAPLGIPLAFRPEISLINASNIRTATLPPKRQVIYRILYREVGSATRGAPSFPVRVTNESSSTGKNPSLYIVHPNGITTDHELEIYRSNTVDTSQNLLADDELFRIKTLSITDSPSITFVDTYSPLEQPLYTNASIEGVQNSSYGPPYAQSICFHKGIACYANVTKKASIVLKLTFLSDAGGRLRITNGNTYIEVSGDHEENKQSNIFNINDVNSLKNAIQNHPYNNFLNVYDIQVEDLNTPTLLLECTNYKPFKIQLLTNKASDRALGKYLSPKLTPDNPLVVSPSHYPNRIYFSKFEEAYSVPLYRYFSIGQSDKTILRIISFRDTLFVFKEDGLFRIDGNSFSHFSVSNFLKDLLLVSKNSLSILEDQLYCFSNYGFIRINENGYEKIAAPIENNILDNFSYEDLFNSSFGMSHRREKQYLFFYKQKSQLQASSCYVYNTSTQQWTMWKKEAQVAAIDHDNNLIILDYNQKSLVKQRNSITLYDWRDESYFVDIASYTNSKPYEIVIQAPDILPFPIKNGMFLSQGLSYSRIKQVDSNDSTITLHHTHPFSINVKNKIEISKPIPIVIGYNRLFF